ncbi:MAG: hypothetical protein NTW96_04660 [Planctomycetia bacterium]|nr:hypothetical protein [Planctomycetia bacterium]
MERTRMTSLAGALTLLAVSLPTPVSAEVRYTVTDLSAIWEVANPAIADAFTYMIPRSTSLSDQGQVVGAYMLYAEDPRVWAVEYGFVWDPTVGLHEFGPDWYPAAISDAGLAVAVTWSTFLLWDRDHGSGAAFPRENLASFYDVNDSGAAVGAGFPATLDGDPAIQWDTENGVRSLGTFGADRAQATEINNQGQVLGLATYRHHDDAHQDFWFLSDPETGTHNLGDMNDTQFIAVNDLGQVVGSGYRPVPDPEFPWLPSSFNSLLLWQDGNMTELETLRDGELCVGGANNAGEIVGIGYHFFEDSTYQYGFLWNESDGLQDLNDLIAAESPWRITWANDVNNKGWIVCQALDMEGRERILMLTPVPEPLPLISLCGGIIMLILSWRVNWGKQSAIWHEGHESPAVRLLLTPRR